MSKRIIYKTADGFTDNGSPWGCTMFWDKHGTYVGQEQMNCMDDDPDAPATLFFKAQGNREPVEFALSEEEIESAI